MIALQKNECVLCVLFVYYFRFEYTPHKTSNINVFDDLCVLCVLILLKINIKILLYMYYTF